MADTIRAKFHNIPDNIDIGLFIGNDIGLDDSLALVDDRQHRALASLERVFDYQRRLETYVRILEAKAGESRRANNYVAP